MFTASTYTKFGRSVNELQFDLLQVFAGGRNHETFPDRDNSLLRPWY